MKTCRFIREGEVVWVPSPDSWLGGWTRQRWLEQYFKDVPARSASANVWSDMCEQKKVRVLIERNGEYEEMSLKKFRKQST